MMEQKSSLVIAVIALVVGAVGGFMLGRGAGVVGTSSEVVKLQQQVEQAKKLFPALPQDVRSVSGRVKEVRGTVIVMETFSANPFDETPRTRNVTVGSNTKIIRNEQKDPAAYQREFAEFQKAIQAQQGKPSSTAPTPPTPFREVAVKIADVKTGDQISVTADENIRDKESFTAKSITVVSMGAGAGIPGGVPPPPPPSPSRGSAPAGGIGTGVPPPPPPLPSGSAPAGGIGTGVPPPPPPAAR